MPDAPFQIRPARADDRLPLAVLFAAVAEERDGIATEPPVDVEARAASWTIEGTLEKDQQQFAAKLHRSDGKKAEIPNQDAADRILDDLKGKNTFEVTEVKRRERRKNDAGEGDSHLKNPTSSIA